MEILSLLIKSIYSMLKKNGLDVEYRHSPDPIVIVRLHKSIKLFFKKVEQNCYCLMISSGHMRSEYSIVVINNNILSNPTFNLDDYHADIMKFIDIHKQLSNLHFEVDSIFDVYKRRRRSIIPK